MNQMKGLEARECYCELTKNKDQNNLSLTSIYRAAWLRVY